MARQEVLNGDQGLVARTKINENFEELYSFFTFTVNGTAQTVGNATVDIITIPVAIDTSIAITFEVYGDSATDGDQVFARYICGFRNNAGVLTLIDGSVDQIARVSDDVQVAGDATVSGTDAIIQVTGKTGETFDWIATAGVKSFTLNPFAELPA